MEVITKAEFAKRCGVSTTSVFKWIQRNRDGIRDYITEDGIKDTIFTVAPWNQMNTRPRTQSEAARLRDELATAMNEAAEQRTVAEDLRKQLADANQRNEALQKESEQMRVTLADLEEAKRNAESLQLQLIEANHKSEMLAQEVEHQKEIIADKDKWLAEKDGHIQQLYALNARMTLPAPKKPLGTRIKEFFTGTKTE